jgi:hypothetical protein
MTLDTVFLQEGVKRLGCADDTGKAKAGDKDG